MAVPITRPIKIGDKLMLIKEPSHDLFGMKLFDAFEVIKEQIEKENPYSGWVIKRFYPFESRLEFVYIVPANLPLFKRL